MNVNVIAREFARRYILFHFNQDWKTINCWLLATYSDVKYWYEKGELSCPFGQNKGYLSWFVPSEYFYTTYILPIIKKVLIGEIKREDF